MNTKVFFEEVNGKQIFCILSQPRNSNGRLILMNHGFRGSSLGPARTFVDFEKLLLGEGYSILRFDQPNCGNSEGSFADSSFNDWIQTSEHFLKKYTVEFEVGILGQSMGATVAGIVAGRNPDLVRCLLLWVPDPKSDVDVDPNRVYEEAGQKYPGKFWIEARDSDLIRTLSEYTGSIHLVYGETDKYIDKTLRDNVMDCVRKSGNEISILDGQDHSSWDYDAAQQVYRDELRFVSEYWS